MVRVAPAWLPVQHRSHHMYTDNSTEGLCSPPVKVDVQFGRFVLGAQQKWLLQSLDVLYVQVLTPLAEILPLQPIQELHCLAVGEKYLLVNA